MMCVKSNALLDTRKRGREKIVRNEEERRYGHREEEVISLRKRTCIEKPCSIAVGTCWSIGFGHSLECVLFLLFAPSGSFQQSVIQIISVAIRKNGISDKLYQ